MRIGIAGLPGLLLLALPSLAGAATPPHIEQPVRLGLPAGPDAGRSRNGAWAPVYLNVQGGAEGNAQNVYRIAILTTDSEGVPSRYTVSVPALGANDSRVLQGYFHPGTDGSEVTVQLESVDGAVLQSIPHLQRDASTFKNEIVFPRQVFYLTLGARLPGLRRMGKEAPKKPVKEGEEDEEGSAGDKRSFGFIENVAAMPDRWFGYDGVDVIVLATGSETFVDELLQDGAASRRAALLDWVRQGGRLVISVGRNHQRAARLLERLPLARGKLTGSTTLPFLRNVAFWSGRGGAQAPLRDVRIATVVPGPRLDAMVREETGGKELPILLQSPCGLGRVVLVAFDLDLPPFTLWEGQAAFWTRLNDEIAPPVPVLAQAQMGSFGQNNPSELAAEIKRNVESFEEVPVISFGWVALFILLYIILVGPLDYFLLKKVFKRLELTWITFPTVVLIVSVSAYFIAYSLKGDSIRISKIDVIDIDLNDPPRIYGTSWIGLFSPRIQSYTVGLEPASPGWAAQPSEDQTQAAVLAPLDTPEQTLGTGSQGLFQRPYEYAPEATGIERMPIPVWATRAFTATWQAPLPDEPVVEASLRPSRDGQALIGAITNHLPVELQDVTLFYRGKGYKLGDLVPGEQRPVNPLFERGVQPQDLSAWLVDDTLLRPRLGSLPTKEGRRSRTTGSSYRLLKPVMFYHEATRSLYNSGLRRLDQDWRLQPEPEVPTPPRPRFREEAVLVARTPLLADRAEDVTRAGTASRLWLDRLPGPAAKRPDLPGYLTQETYVRIYVPVQTAPIVPNR